MEYTVESANQLAAELRALPAKDPAQRRLDKQGMVRHIVEAITELQERGYTLEEVAQSLTSKGLEITTPTLKSYLQRVKKASGKGAAKAPRRSPSTVARIQASPGKTKAETAPPPPPRAAKADSVESTPRDTRSEFIATDRKRL
jgi:hypothetical protein